ncbi:F-box only protein 46 [Myotis brandtii]|uniref:F-box only protein 46 n=1 Tax=Myotis brandtii TaxID=109478 RepID=S7MWC7_MYOBR|nr:F-box only protein 46 [Myotis brandtii]
MDVVVTGVVDECIFFGKDGTKNGKEETVCLTSRGPDGPPESPPADSPATAPRPDDNEGTADTSLCRLSRHVSQDFLEIRFKIQRLLEPRQDMLLLPEHLLLKIFSSLPTRALAALKCTCHHFKTLIEAFCVWATDSRWSRGPPRPPLSR